MEALYKCSKCGEIFDSQESCEIHERICGNDNGQLRLSDDILKEIDSIKNKIRFLEAEINLLKSSHIYPYPIPYLPMKYPNSDPWCCKGQSSGKSNE